MSKKIVLSGYYGFDNLGDEAVLLAIIRALRDEETDLDILVLSNNPAKTAAAYGVEAKNRWNIRGVYKALKEADLLISGGGSLLQDVTSSMTIPYYLGVVAMARFLGKKVAFYAQGIGPITGILGKGLTSFFANLVHLITVRDEESKQILYKLGVKRPPVKVTVDPVVLLQETVPTTKEYGYIHELQKFCSSKGVPLIGLAPRPWMNLTGFKEILIETARKLKSEFGAEFLLLPMHRDVDLPLCEEMALQIPNAKVIKEFYKPDELLAFFKKLDLLIGIRLHALIFAAVAHVPLIGISYDPKIDAFLKRIDEQAVADIQDINEEILYSEIIHRLNHLDNYRQQIKEKISVLQQYARDNARMVLGLLK